jgi:hypothetical protein
MDNIQAPLDMGYEDGFLNNALLSRLIFIFNLACLQEVQKAMARAAATDTKTDTCC